MTSFDPVSQQSEQSYSELSFLYCSIQKLVKLLSLTLDNFDISILMEKLVNVDSGLWRVWKWLGKNSVSWWGKVDFSKFREENIFLRKFVMIDPYCVLDVYFKPSVQFDVFLRFIHNFDQLPIQLLMNHYIFLIVKLRQF